MEEVAGFHQRLFNNRDGSGHNGFPNSILFGVVATRAQRELACLQCRDVLVILFQKVPSRSFTQHRIQYVRCHVGLLCEACRGFILAHLAHCQPCLHSRRLVCSVTCHHVKQVSVQTKKKRFDEWCSRIGERGVGTTTHFRSFIGGM